MNSFELELNQVLVDTYNSIVEVEQASLQKLPGGPVTVAEAHVIEAIGQAGSTTVSEIAAALDIAVPTATVAVKKLELKRYITKIQCAEDGRRAIVKLTDKGKRVDRAHRMLHYNMVRNISQDMSAQEQAVLLSAMHKLSQFFQTKTLKEAK